MNIEERIENKVERFANTPHDDAGRFYPTDEEVAAYRRRLWANEQEFD